MKRALLYLVLAALGLVMLVPFLWMALAAMKDPALLMQVPPDLQPWPLSLTAFGEMSDVMPVGLFFWNSVKIALLGTLGELIAASLAAYAFARFEFRGKKLLFGVLLVTLMIPFQVTMVPVFVIMNWLGWNDTHAALIVPHFFGGAFASAAFGIFMLRSFFEEIPRELEDAARIDGAGHFRIFYKVVLPLAKPALAVLALFVFMGIWNDLLGPVLFLTSEELMPLPYGLAALQTAAQHMSRYDILMAGTLVSVLPVIVLYILAQKQITEAFMQAGLKG
ncbi:MAG TPA: carbohydrate ABC transporter permease [Candidatus Kapabacteria bacterium]|nr:carbohydrate ABC transporter permease [Candidatus Kapabacteria bacterium]